MSDDKSSSEEIEVQEPETIELKREFVEQFIAVGKKLNEFDEDQVLHIISGNYKDVDSKVLSDLSNESENISPEEIEKLYIALSNQPSKLAVKGSHGIFDDGGQWHNIITHPETRTYRSSLVKPGKNIEKLDPTIAMAELSGTGGRAAVDLFGSGFTIRLRGMNDRTRSMIFQKIRGIQIDSLVETYGLLPNGHNSQAIRVIMESLVGHVLGANFQNTGSTDEFFNSILVTDIDALIATWLAASYPRGYPVDIHCINDLSKCNHVERKNLSFSNSVFMSDRITTELTMDMAEFTKTKTAKDLSEHRAKYQPTKEIDIGSYLDYDGVVKVTLRIPTLSQLFNESENWYEEITTEIVNTFRDRISKDERKQYINTALLASNLCRYSPYIESITYYDSEGDLVKKVDNRESIKDTLENLSGTGVSTDFKSFLISEIINYTYESKYSAVGYYREKCPSCGALPEANEGGVNKNIIEMDMVHDFFTIIQGWAGI